MSLYIFIIGTQLFFLKLMETLSMEKMGGGGGKGKGQPGQTRGTVIHTNKVS